MPKDCEHCYHYGRMKDGNIGCAIEDILRTDEYEDACPDFVRWR